MWTFLIYYWHLGDILEPSENHHVLSHLDNFSYRCSGSSVTSVLKYTNFHQLVSSSLPFCCFYSFFLCVSCDKLGHLDTIFALLVILLASKWGRLWDVNFYSNSPSQYPYLFLSHNSKCSWEYTDIFPSAIFIDIIWVCLESFWMPSLWVEPSMFNEIHRNNRPC